MKKNTNGYFVALFLVVLVVGFLLRFAQLSTSDFWYDEAFTAIVIRAPWKDMWAYLVADKVHPPLYYLLLRNWVGIFGTTLTAIRSYSLLFGMAILPMAYLIIQQLSLERKEKQQFGLVMMTVFAVSPFFVTYSVEARSYSFLAFLILTAVFLFLRMTKQLYKITWTTLAFVVTVAAIAFTHYISILVVLGFAVTYALLVMVDKKWFTNGAIWGNIGKLLLVGWVGFTLVWHHFNLERLVEKQNLGWIPQSDLSTLIRVVYVFLFGVDRQSLGLPVVNQFSFPLLPNSVGIVILCASLVAIIFAIKKLSNKEDQVKDLLVLLSIGLVPLVSVLLASSLGLNIYVDRYVIGYGTMLLLAFGYAWWVTIGKSFVIVLVGYFVLLSCLILPQASTKYSDTYNTLLAYGHIVPIVENPLDFVVFKSYFGEGNVKVLQRSNGSYYDWALISHTDEVNINTVPAGTLVVWSQYSDKMGVDNNPKFEKFQETSDFVIYQVLN
ncbi:glycosyltransferase family 39 protein [bacterium]|nr:glycosyltransferase family 39 protein [bacterium]